MKKSILATALVAMTVTFNGVANALKIDSTDAIQEIETAKKYQTAKNEIAKMYQAVDAAFERKDIDQYFSYFAPEYTRVGLDGKLINLKLEREQVQQLLQKVRQIKVNSKIKQIQTNEQTVTVVGVTNFSGTITDPQNPQVTKPLSIESTYQDIWKRTNSGWKILSARTLSQKNTNTIPLTNQGNNERNYMQALNLASIAINKCYKEKNLVECDKLGQIENTLMTWCQQNDRAACSAYSAVQSNKQETELIEMVGN